MRGRRSALDGGKRRETAGPRSAAPRRRFSGWGRGAGHVSEPSGRVRVLISQLVLRPVL